MCLWKCMLKGWWVRCDPSVIVSVLKENCSNVHNVQDWNTWLMLNKSGELEGVPFVMHNCRPCSFVRTAYKHDWLSAPPEITVFEGPEFGRGYEGHSAQIQCQAVGKPKPEYKWHKNVVCSQRFFQRNFHAVDLTRESRWCVLWLIYEALEIAELDAWVGMKACSSVISIRIRLMGRLVAICIAPNVV